MTQTLHEARFYDRLGGAEVVCTLCPHDCRIREGGRGACGVRFNDRGTLYTLAYDRVANLQIDPVEKKPLFHFYPGSRACSIATIGCNLRCDFCQNWVLSQWPKDVLPKRLDELPDPEASGRARPQLAAIANAIVGEPMAPAAIVALAQSTGSRSIAYTYTEPTVFYELAYDTAALARARGLKNIFVTNGFISEAPLRELATVLDAANVDLKFFRPESHRRIARAGLEPVLAAIRLFRALGVWVEVTTLVIPGVNDSDEELRAIATFLRAIGADVPWHVSPFSPAYKMMDRPITPVATLRRAAEIGREAGLRHVYEGNVPGEGEDTRCHACGALLIARPAFELLSNRIANGRCPDCGTSVDGIGMSADTSQAYRSTHSPPAWT
jgi:pyruvate formate lyase activating enzyme